MSQTNAGRKRHLRNSFVCDCAVVNVIEGALQLVQAEKGASAPGEKHVFRILEVVLLGPRGRFPATVGGQVRALGEEQEPHGIEVLVPVGANMLLLQLLKSMRKSWLIGRHLARHENEAVEHHASADARNVLERLLENDVDVTVHARRVCVGHPP